MIRLSIVKSSSNKTSLFEKLKNTIRIKTTLNMSFKDSWYFVNQLSKGKEIIIQPLNFNAFDTENAFIEWLSVFFLFDFQDIITKISDLDGYNRIVDTNKYNYFIINKVVTGKIIGITILKYNNIKYSIYIQK